MNALWDILIITAELLAIVAAWGMMRAPPTPSAHPDAVENRLGLKPASGYRFVGVLRGVPVETSWALEDGVSVVRTTVKAYFALPLDLGLRIESPVPPYHPVQTRPWLAGVSQPTGGTISVCADDVTRVTRLLGNGEVERRLTALAAYAQLTVDDTGVALHMRRTVDAAWTQWALDQVVNAVAALEEGRGRVGIAGGLQSLSAAYVGVAQRFGVAAMRVPLGIWGRVHGVPVVAHAIRRSRTTFGFVMTAWLPFELPLTVRQRSDLFGRFEALFDEGRIVEVPHDTFRKRFEVRALDPDRAKAVLSSTLCDLLVELSRRGQVEVEQGAVRVELTRPPDAHELGALLGLLSPLGAVSPTIERACE